MQNVIAILQIKSRNSADFYLWVKWYHDIIKCDKIYVIDDNSSYDLTKIIGLFDNVYYRKQSTIKQSLVFPNFNKQLKILNGLLEEIIPEKDDIIITPDNDEFWWYDKTKYNSFVECVNDFRNKLGNPSALYVPWTLMRSKEIMQKRKPSQNFFECFRYRANVSNCEHKPVIFYKGILNTSFHCGYTDGKTITEPTNLFYHSKCVYDLPLRCYHFRFTTIEEYENKRYTVSSGKNPRSYMKENQFTPQIFNGEDQNGIYNILDETLINTLNEHTK